MKRGWYSQRITHGVFAGRRRLAPSRLANELIGWTAMRIWAISLGTVLLAGCGASPTLPIEPTVEPVLTCPADLVLQGAMPIAEVIYPKPTLIGGEAPIRSECSPRQGAFPRGTTVVTCATTDAQGRNSTCNFRVTVLGQPSPFGRIVAFGDSVTAGEDGLGGGISELEAQQSYPNQLAGLLQARYPAQDAVVESYGLPGEPVVCAVGETFCALNRLPMVLSAAHPDALLLLEGYNDLSAIDEAVGNRPAVVTRTSQGLRQAALMAREMGVRVFLATLTPGRPGTIPRNRQLSSEGIVDLNSELATIASQDGLTLVDTYSTFIGREAVLVNSDGLHLTQQGYLTLAQVFLQSIDPLVNIVTSPAGRRLTLGPRSGRTQVLLFDRPR